MTLPLVDDAPLDLAGREQFEQDRRSVVQPTPAEDLPALDGTGVKLAPCPRQTADGELLRQPWVNDESSWRHAPK